MARRASLLKKYTIRLPIGAPEKLAELFGLPYNQVIRLALGKLIRSKMEEAANNRAETALELSSDEEFVAALDAALASDNSMIA